MFFVSHSSKDISFVEQLCRFLKDIGITPEEIFCSSVEGQGVKSGKRISDEIKTTMQQSELFIYVITKNFLASPYCVQELSAGWVLDNPDCKKHLFLLKMPDVTPDEINGFVNADFKYNELTSESLDELIDDISEACNLSRKKATEIGRMKKLLLENSKEFVQHVVAQATISAQEKFAQKIAELEEQIPYLNEAEKEIIAEIFCCGRGCTDLEITDGVTALLENKHIIRRLTTISDGLYFSYGFQPWFEQYLRKNKTFAEDIKQIYKKDNESHSRW